MSETVGLHAQLTADAGSFNAAMDMAVEKLVDLNQQAKVLKQGEKDIQKALEESSRKYGENSRQVERLKADLIENAKAQMQVKSEIKQVNKVLQTQQNEFSQTAAKANSMTDQLKSGFLMLKGLAVGYAGKTLYDALIGTNADFEQSMTSFDVLLGSAEKAERMMNDLEQFAATTPLKMEDTQKAATMLMGFGVEAENLIDIMGRLGDLSQGNAEKLNRISLAYGQMLAKGKVTGEEMRQMVEAQVPLLQALADYLNVSTAELQDMISAGTVGIDDLNGAIKAMTSEGGQFFGMMEKQSHTLNGMISTLGDNFTIFARNVGEGSFEYLKGEAESLLSTVNQMSADGSLQEMAGDIGEDIAKAVTVIANFIKILWDMRGALFAVGGGVVAFKTLAALMPTITTLTTSIKLLNNAIEIGNVKQVAGNIISGKTVVLKNLETGAITLETAAKAKEMLATEGATVAQVKFNAAILANPYTWAIAAIAGLSAAFIYLADTEDKANKRAQEAVSAYREAESELERLQTQLDETTQKIDELNAKDKLTLTEKGELENLQAINRELNTSIILAKKQAEDKAKEANKKIEERNKRDFLDTSEFMYPGEYAYSEEQVYKNRVKQAEKLIALGDKRTEQQEKELQNQRDYIADAGKRYQEDADGYVAYDEQTEKTKQHWQEMADLAAKVLDPEGWQKIKFDELFDSKTLESTKNTLLEMAKAGEITPEVINSIDEFKALMEDTGLTAQDIATEINGMVEATELTAVESMVQDLNDFFGALKMSYSDNAILGGIVDEVINLNNSFVDGNITVDEYFSNLNEKISSVDFSNLGSDEAMQGLFSGLTQATTQGIEYITKQFADGAITVDEYTDSLSVANANMLKLYTTSNNLSKIDGNWIDEAGNIDEYANSLQSAQDQLAGFDPYISTMSDNIDYLSEHIDSFGNAAFTAADTANASFKTLASDFAANLEYMYTTNRTAFDGIVNDVASATGLMVSDIVNSNGQINQGVFANNVALNAGINAANNQLGQSINKVTSAAGKVLNALGKAISSFNYTITLKPNVTSMGRFNLKEWMESGGKSGIELPNISWNIRGQGGSSVTDLGAAISDFGVALSDVDLGGINVNSYMPTGGGSGTTPSSGGGGGRGGSGGGGGGGSSSSKDTWKEAAEEEINALKHKLKMEEITQQEYYDSLLAIQQKYYAGREEYIDEDRKLTEELYSIQKDLQEKWFKDKEHEIELLSHQEGSNEQQITIYQEMLKRTEELAAKAREQGIADNSEYIQTLQKEWWKYFEAIEDLRKDDAERVKDRHDEQLKESKQYIEDRNFYGDWEEGDNEIKAWQRVMERSKQYMQELDQLWQDGKIDDDTYWEYMSDISGDIAEMEREVYSLAKEEMESYINEQADAIKESYQKALDYKKASIEGELELRKKALDEERAMIEEAADKEIAKIDKILESRKRLREDEDDNKKLERLQASLAYEVDENNRKSLQKEIDKLTKDMEDKAFEREMEQKKEDIQRQKELDLNRIDEIAEYEERKAAMQIDATTKYFEEQMSGVNLAKLVSDNLNLAEFEEIGNAMGESIKDGINNALGGLISAISNTLEELSGAKSTDISNISYITKTFSPTYNYSGEMPSPAQQANNDRKLIERLRLSGM